MPITIYSRPAGSVEVVSLIGRCTAGADQHEFRLRTREILAGLGEIVAAYTAAASGRQLKLLSPQRHFQVLFRVTRLDNLLESFNSQTDALATY